LGLVSVEIRVLGGAKAAEGSGAARGVSGLPSAESGRCLLTSSLAGLAGKATGLTGAVITFASARSRSSLLEMIESMLKLLDLAGGARGGDAAAIGGPKGEWALDRSNC